MSAVASIERPKRGHFYPRICEDIATQQCKDDPQALKVYEWERAMLCIGRHLIDDAVTREELRHRAVAYLEHLWRSYSGHFDPYFSGIPYLRLGRLEAYHNSKKGHARISTHEIYLASALLQLWQHEFSVDRDHALNEARRLGVEVRERAS